MLIILGRMLGPGGDGAPRLGRPRRRTGQSPLALPREAPGAPLVSDAPLVRFSGPMRARLAAAPRTFRWLPSAY